MASNRMLGLGLSILMFSATLTGCLGLAFQREFMEEMREDPVVRLTEETYGFDYTFESNSLESVYYTDSVIIEFDSSVSQLVINFRAQFPYSSIIEELPLDNGTNQYRYVHAMLWKPGVKESGGEAFWEVRATQDFPQDRITFSQSDLISGNWVFEVEARGYGFSAPIDQASFYDSFDTYVTITKPCVVFAESHESEDCTPLSDLQSS